MFSTHDRPVGTSLRDVDQRMIYHPDNSKLSRGGSHRLLVRSAIESDECQVYAPEPN